MFDETGYEFEVGQARQLGEAVRSGDDGRAEQLRQHLVAEGATSDADAAELDAFTQALTLFAQYTQAAGAGQADRAAELQERLLAEHGPERIRQVSAVAMLQAGARQGWLPADQHDQLRDGLDAAGLADDYAVVFGGIERR
ncbi:hypothetical protein AB0M43_38295 [Longispora sp. NPDC051575]|uniref:hypothetical protein n=1 Tax=Longispora sp. NPDC051575 TaxID=3154943 RepID=UPI0034317188